MNQNRRTLLCRYHYDPLDRLSHCARADHDNTQRFYLKDRLTTEIQGASQHCVFQHGDFLLAQQRRGVDGTQTVLIASDRQRSVLNELGADGPHGRSYSPYGHRDLGGLLGLLGFNGEQPDSVTGHYLLGNGYRAFNPVLMRFNSPDSWSPFGEGGLNVYAYCVGDPVNRVDPTGHVSWLSLMAKYFPRAVTAANKLTPGTKFSRAMGIQPSVASITQKTLLDLPNEMIEQIADHLPGKDLSSFASTSKRIYAVVYSESRHQRFLRYIDKGSGISERLLRLDAVGVGSEYGISPKYAVDSGYNRSEVLNKIAENNRRYYLPVIERVEQQKARRDVGKHLKRNKNFQ